LEEKLTLKIAVITISDRSFKGEREDLTGKQLINYLKEKSTDNLILYKIIPDEKEIIKKELTYHSKAEKVNVILTCGGTGFAKRDVTPEATGEIIQKLAPGIAELIRYENSKKNINSYLSRGICGIFEDTIIINLPGSPDGALSCYKIVEPLLNHGVELINGSIKDCKK
jgi:molybdenum cofactor synthesis domain-containing protein